ncbi:fasciclin domain-containing protein 2 [Elsinoe australis]|uniref:Fasciclin domain-containing protein 2 n=1 Tax=Elsinoe australis TaxID=40998 RepID=A0A4U7B3C5_9PEZI|nr:fasciclin domain-containing protein 2 [Elsinoe australis]
MKLSTVVLCTSSLLSATSAKSLKSVLSTDPKLSILNGLLDQFDLLETFNSAKDVTLLAPSNAAYEALAKWGFNVSEVPAPVATALLSYHLLEGQYPASSIPTSGPPEIAHTYLKPPVLTNVTKGAAVKLSRGGSGEIVTESGLSVLGGTEDTDVKYDNGIVHTLNSSMVLPHNISATLALNQLTEFLQDMSDASTVYQLEELKDVTFFFPINSALKKLSPLLSLLSPTQLASVLQYHAVPNKVLYHDRLEGDSEYKTLNGDSIRVHSDARGNVFVNDAQVVRQDLIIYGGVAHIIDDVLIPRDMPKTTSVAGRFKLQVPA